MAAAEQLYVDESGWWREACAFNASGAPISAAVGAAAAGDAIYVHGGRYDENVNVDTPRLTLEGEGADVVTVTAASSGDHVFEVTANYVNISGFVVRGATDSDVAGICLDNADYCNISENDAYGNRYGIYLCGSGGNMLENNTANSNNYYGIRLSNSNNNILENNTANSNHAGIYLDYSSSNTLTSNNLFENEMGIYLYSSSNNMLQGNNASSNQYCYGIGFYIDSSSDNMLHGNTANLNDVHGIYLLDSSSNTLEDNTANLNGEKHGIYLDYSSNNTLTNNTANLNDEHGIRLRGSSNNTLTNNIINSNNHGIGLLGSSNNNDLTNNTVNSNNYGIGLGNADNNNITCNWVQNNTQRSFHLTGGSTGNTIEHNNIIENGNHNATSGGWKWQLYIDQYQPVEAKHNYWGAGMNSSTIDASIYDTEGGWGEVEFYPFKTEPVPCAPGPERPAFTTADAVIALEIAAGSRPPDLRWDVSGDGSVTSLDALMILRAVAGSIGIG
jgi:parallel beta-helix repeat protein